MAGYVIGTTIARPQQYHLDVNRSPFKVYRISRQNHKEIKKEPNVYSIYCRLCQLQSKSGVSVTPGKSHHKQPSVELSVPGERAHKPKVDPLKCRCDKTSLQILRQIQNETPRNYNKTQPARFTHDRFMNEILSNFLINETAQMPLSTLVIRWRLGRSLPTYEKADLLGLLSCYGSVRAVIKQTPNSATIVFNDTISACRVIQAKHLGEPRNKIHCVWYHKFMSNKSFYSANRGLRVHRDPYIAKHDSTVPVRRG